MIIYIQSPDIQKALCFASSSVKFTNGADFGTASRIYQDKFCDIFKGKIAELAASKLFVLQRLFPVPDFRIYEDVHIGDIGNDFETCLLDDGKDIEPFLNPLRIDVKATAPYSKWLLVEGGKLVSSAYLLMKVDMPDDIGAILKDPGAASRPIKTEAAGYCYYFDLVDRETGRPWFLFKNHLYDFPPSLPTDPATAKEVIKHLNTPMDFRLKANRNIGMPIPLLRKDIGALGEKIRGGLVQCPS